jgi:hypothetical protein
MKLQLLLPWSEMEHQRVSAFAPVIANPKTPSKKMAMTNDMRGK